MKYYYSIGILLLLINSCSINKITKQYLANDDVCFCGLDSTRLQNEEIFDLKELDFNNKQAEEEIDTLFENSDTLVTWGFIPSKGFVIFTKNKNTSIITEKDYASDGKINYKMTYFIPTKGVILYLGYYASFDENGRYKRESNENYIKSADFNKSDTIAQKYPICWKEALNLVKAKIGNYELLGLSRPFHSEPNYKGMEYFWTVEAKKKWRKPKYYYVDAVTGRVERAIIIASVGWDDMLD